jgi:hypothetical protein
MDSIRSSRVAPLRKARLLLRIGRALQGQVATLMLARAQTSRSKDRNGSDLLLRMARRSEQLHEDVREAAIDALAKEED